MTQFVCPTSSPQATSANISTTNQSRYPGVSGFLLQLTSPVLWPTSTLGNAYTATSRVRTYSLPRTAGSRSPTLDLLALPPATRKSPVVSPFVAQTHTCLLKSFWATSLTSPRTSFLLV